MQLIHTGNHSSLFLYREDQDCHGRAVALKLLNNEYPAPHEKLQINNEYAILNGIELPGVRRVLKKASVSGKEGLILEYIDGKPLAEVFEEPSGNIGFFLKVAINIASSLSQVHQHNIIHRDLNYYNILYDAQSQRTSIIDFGIASTFSLKSVYSGNPSHLEGNLSFISPEQTGRMNRVVDTRTDLYSLGVCFYYMLTERLPFQYEDMNELVYAHLAEKPLPPTEYSPNCPELLSSITLKLLEKNAEDRYQSAHGLLHDLKKAAQCWEDDGGMPSFPLGDADFSGQLQFPQKLYGRDKEIERLLEAFERTADGTRAFLPISGSSGTGKSALVQEFYSLAAPRNVNLLSGKYNKLQRDLPYSGIVRAIEGFVEQLLLESDKELLKWKQVLQRALGDMGGVLTELVPSMELIIGTQPKVPELGGQEAQNRFQETFRSFINGISTSENSLLIFLDDLQWADTASLDLVKALMEDSDMQYLLIIGSFRDNETDDSHPLTQAIQDLRDKELCFDPIHLQNLNTADLHTFLAETLNSTPTHIEPLATLILQKTEGNIFFIIQILKSLYEEGLLAFDFGEQQWKWNLEQLKKGIQLTEGVASLMAEKINRLPKSTQYLLSLGACIGSTFKISDLNEVIQQKPGELHRGLRPALEGGMIIPLDDNYRFADLGYVHSDGGTYRFAHDRIQQAAYAQLNQRKQQATHLTLARNLWRNYGREKRQQKLIEITSHYNLGLPLVVEVEEQLLLAKLNLKAGLKAKNSVAYGSALNYFKCGLSLIEVLPSSAEDHELSFQLAIQCAVSLGILGELSQAESVFEKAIALANSPYDRGICYEQKSLVLQSAGRSVEALEAAKAGLAQFGIVFSNDEQAIQKATEENISLLVQGETLQSFEQLGHGSKEGALIGTLYDRCVISVYFVEPQNLSYVVSQNVAYILSDGLAPESSVALAWFAMILGMMEQKPLSFRYGDLALRTAELFNSPYFKAKAHTIAYGLSLCWKLPFKDSEQALQRSYLLCHNNGELQYASYALISKYIAVLLQGADYEKVLRDCKAWHDYCLKYVPLELGQAQIRLHLLQRLMGIDVAPLDYEAIIERYQQSQNFTDVSESLVELARFSYLVGKYQEGWEFAMRAEPLVQQGSMGNLLLNFQFYFDLCMTACRLYESTSGEEYLQKAKEILPKLEGWAELNPKNFDPYYLLAKGELLAVTGELDISISWILKAIKKCKRQRYTLLQAVANERIAHIYEYLGYPSSQIHLQQASQLYQHCGALLKVEPELLTIQTYSDRTRTVSRSGTRMTHTRSGSSSIDIQTIVKANQAFAGEVVLKELLQKMMGIVIENAGAENGFLILKRDRKWLVEAAIRSRDLKLQMMQSIPFESLRGEDGKPVMLHKVLYYVIRTQKSELLDNALADERYAAEPYVVENSIKSLFCMPLMNKRKTVGILYLENNLTTNAFTNQQVEILSTLSSQMSISIENAMLYESLEQKVQERTRQVMEQKEEVTRQRDRITDSIRYAQTIQSALLPTLNDLKGAFNDVCVLYQPKDIVSGDFYWMGRKGGTIYVALADCTGHGVPGAFMSMLGIEYLNKILNVEALREPRYILERLNQYVISGLKQEAGLNRDGMDISLCSITAEGNGKYHIVFAGAKHSLLFRHRNGDFQTIKGSRSYIGGGSRMQQRKSNKFQQHEINLYTGDCLLMYSDGLTDQASPLREKFGRARLQQVLNQQPKESGAKELGQAIEQALKSHCQDTPQRDDISTLLIEL